MLLVKPKITKNIYDNDGYNQILSDIDAKVASLGKQQYLHHAYAEGKGADLALMEKLSDYREILMGKLMGCNCFDEDYIVKIISRIQKLIYS